MKTVAITDTCSPRCAEYGNFMETKNDLNAFKLNGDDRPKPVVFETVIACMTQVVMVSGTVTRNDTSPSLLKTNIKKEF